MTVPNLVHNVIISAKEVCFIGVRLCVSRIPQKVLDEFMIILWRGALHDQQKLVRF